MDFSYYDGLVLRDVDLTLKHGEFVGLLGPNGPGKTTLLKVLSGLLPPRRGRVFLDGQDIRRLKRRQITHCVAVAPQELDSPFGFTAYEMVTLGRTPHVRPLVGARQRDRQVVAEKMRLTGIRQVFGAAVEVQEHPTRHTPHVVLLPLTA